jgi:hypothetical protein
VGPVTLKQPDAAEGLSVISGRIGMPRIGAWTADLWVASSTVVTGPVDLQVSPGLTLRGTVARAGVHETLLHVRIVGGANGLRSFVTPKHYTAPTLRVVLKDLLADVGETLSSTVSPTLLNTQFQHWTTLRMPAARAIRCVLERAASGISWRHLPDGTFWIGSETWPESAVNYADLDAMPEDDVLRLILDAPELLPGTAIAGRRLDAIDYELRAGGLITTAWLASSDPMAQPFDRLKGAFTALAGPVPTALYQNLYRARVLKQHANLKRLDLQADAVEIPPLSNIPLRIGVPGLDATLAPGHSLLLGWENGQPDRPYASLWEPGTLGTTPLKLTYYGNFIELGGVTTPIVDGVVTGQGSDPYTGMPYWMLGNSSAVVGAKK